MMVCQTKETILLRVDQRGCYYVKWKFFVTVAVFNFLQLSALKLFVLKKKRTTIVKDMFRHAYAIISLIEC